MKKRRKLKKVPFVILIIICFFILYIISNTFLINLNLIGDSNIIIDVGQDYFENGYKSSCFFTKCDNVDIKNNIDSSKEGNYEVTYKLSYLIFNKSIKRKVEVKDIGAPIITLEGEDYIYLNKDEAYNEPGYKAIDSLDGDITKNVSIKGSVDEKVVGTYKLTYSAKDASGNTSTVTRTVEVIDGNIMDTDIASFNLNNYFKSNILNYETKEYNQVKDAIFLGDSNTVFLYERGNFVDKSQIWGHYNLNISQIRTSTFKVFATGQIMDIKKALDTYKPKILIVSSGIDSPLHMKEDNYKKEVELFIKYMQENYADVNLVFTSILPIYHGSIGLWHQKEINAYNFDMLQLCHKYNINFINFADEVKDETGAASKEYFDCPVFEDCGFHLNNAGKEKYMDYLNHINLERKL